MRSPRRLQVRLGTLLVLACALSPRAASAAIVTIYFTGTIQNVYDEGLLDGSLSIGTPFHVRAVYDDAAPPEFDDVGNRTAGWSFPPPAYELSLTAGDYSLIQGPQDPSDSDPSFFFVGLTNAPGFDLYQVAASGRVLSGTLGGGLPVSSSFSVQLNSAGAALTSYLDLAAVPLTLSAWSDAYTPTMSLDFYQLTASDEDPPGLQAGANGQITAIEYSVPEPPATVTAVAFLLASFLVRRRLASTVALRPSP